MLGQVAAIKQAVADETGISVRWIESRRRIRQIAHPRMVAIALTRRLTKLSTTQIGKQFSRDHSTVLAACRRVQSDPLLAACANRCLPRITVVSLGSRIKSEIGACILIGDFCRALDSYSRLPAPPSANAVRTDESLTPRSTRADGTFLEATP